MVEKSRNIGKARANDHITVKHIQTAVAKTENRPQQDYSKKHMTTAHLSEAVSATNAPKPSGEQPTQSVPSSPAPKSGK